MERQRIWEQIQEAEEARNDKVEDEREQSEQTESDIKLELTKIIFDESKILTAEELDGVAADFIGKDVTVNDLYTITERVNKLHADKGYLTCRAFLSEQRIVNGVVKITLVEGCTGKVTVTGNKHTRESFIKKSVKLTEGEITNT